MSKFKVVLASKSPRRKQLLEQIGMEFDIWPSEKEEVVSSDNPKEVCMELCKQKALDVASQIKFYNTEHADITTPQDILVIGADTIVALPDSSDKSNINWKILGKPKDETEAHSMLCKLQGQTHTVFTGVTFVIMSREGRVGEYTFFESTDVTFCELSDDEIDEYIRSGECLDKAGAYGIQGPFAKYVSRINGDFYNVVGLPVSSICSHLNELGIQV